MNRKEMTPRHGGNWCNNTTNKTFRSDPAIKCKEEATNREHYYQMCKKTEYPKKSSIQIQTTNLRTVIQSIYKTLHGIRE